LRSITYPQELTRPAAGPGGPAAGLWITGSYVGTPVALVVARSLSDRLCCTSGRESVMMRTIGRAWPFEDERTATLCAVTPVGNVCALMELIMVSQAPLIVVMPAEEYWFNELEESVASVTGRYARPRPPRDGSELRKLVTQAQ